jgi:murein DD-endopeptidase MepM/ murein hydrolase activator NlpD
MKCKPNWQKIFWKVLTYTLVAILASASTFAVLGERSTTLHELENIIQIKFDAQNSMEKTREELKSQKQELEASKQELNASKSELETSKKDLEASRKSLEEALAQLQNTLSHTEELKELLLTTNQNTQELLEQAKLREQEMADKIAELQDALKELEQQQKKWVMPIEYAYMSSSFGYRYHPITGEYSLHKGVDLAANYGTPIVASRSGVVTVATYQAEGAGYYITIDHEDGFKSQYLHMSRYIVSKGERVVAGQIIGYCGSTGASTGNHLDFRIYHNGEPVDPKLYINFY